MKDEEKTKKQLLGELKKLRAEVENSRERDLKYAALEKALKQSKEKYSLLFENTSEGMVLDELIYDDNGKVVDWKICDVNPGYETILGISRKEVLRKRASKVYGSKQAIAPYLGAYQLASETGTPQHIKIYLKNKNQYLLSSIYPLNGRQVAVIFKDITEVERSNEAFLDSEEKFRVLAETTSAAIFIFQGEQMLYVNQAATTVTGYQAEELTAMKFWDIIHPDFKELVRLRGMARQRQESVPPRYEVKIITKNNEERWVEFTGNTIVYEGNPAVIGTAVDITERKHGEKILKESQARLQALVGSIDEIVFEFDEHGNYLNIWTSDEKLLFLPKKDLIGRNVADILSKEFVQPFLKAFKRTLETGTSETIEYSLEVMGGHRWFLARVNPIPSNGNRPRTVSMLARDITERKQMEAKLLESEERFRSFVENSGEGIYLTEFNPPIPIDLPLEEQIKRKYYDGHIVYCNDVFARMYGVEKAEDIIGKMRPLDAHGTDSNPENNQIYRKFIGANYRIMNAVTEELNKNGTKFYVSNNIVGIIENGHLVRLWGSQQDITERILTQQELQKSSQQLRNLSTHLQTLREEERTRIAREIHDEIGQALTIMKMDLTWLKQKLSHNQPEIEAKLDSLSDFVDTTLDTTRQLTAELRPGILDDFGLAAAIEWQSQMMQERSGIQCKVTTEASKIDLDSERSTAIFRIFQEAMTNVMRHSQASEVEITLTKQNRHLLLTVKDNGIGIDASQTSAPMSLGLIGMRERLYPWGGQVNIQGRPGEGTLVEVILPLSS